MRTQLVLVTASVLTLTAFACAPLGTPTLEPSAVDTAVVGTVQAELTAGAPTETPVPEATETPTKQPTTTSLPEVTATPTESPSPTATETPTPAPTTVEAPDDTPTATATEKPTELPTETSTPPCPAAIAPGFASRLQAHPGILVALGCPIAAARETWAADQRFQLGRTFWQQDTDEIHIVYDSGSFEVLPDQYEDGDPEYTCPEQGPPPDGLVMPKRGFGWHWCNTPGVRDGLGWALHEEIGYSAVWQEFERGHVLQGRLNGIFVFHDDGTWDYIE